MTRYTNVALKRKYVAANTEYRESENLGSDVPEAGPSTPSEEARNDPDAPPKKKRKRGKPKWKHDKQNGVEPGEKDGDEAGEAGEKGAGEGKKGSKIAKGKAKKKSKSNRMSGAEARKAASEHRRLQRQNQRYAETTCYVCREQGHAAKHCPKAGGVGICYRCGSHQHNLSNCKETEDPANPFPFASCFVCSGTGHLASKCPQNASRGVYPNGGCCKLCKENTHLAKDCPLRNSESAPTNAVFLGTGAEAGADEDDFHTFKRKTAEVVKEERADERRKQTAAVKVGAFTGARRVVGRAAPKPKKAVNF